MAIKSDAFGGTDWVDGETLNSTDLLDTIEFPLRYVDSDLTEASIANSATETTLGSITIAANTLANGAAVFVRGTMVMEGTSDHYLRLKIGSFGTEATVATAYAYPAGGTDRNTVSLLYYDSTPNWTGSVSILVTGQNQTTSAGDLTICDEILVLGH